MNGNDLSDQELEGISRDEMLAALFAQMVMQQANMAMMLLGKVPHPQTGQTIRDLEGARMFIDQLEMLEAKTKGNLSKPEENLLKQSLTSLRLAYVESAESGPESASASEPAKPAAAENPVATPESASPAEADSKKKFSKKY